METKEIVDILASLPYLQLKDVCRLLEEQDGVLLEWFTARKSGKGYAFCELKKRFSAQSYSDQQDILRAFLSGTKASADWVAERLLETWIPSLAPDLMACWEGGCHQGNVAKARLRSLPPTYALSQKDLLINVLGYADVCSEESRLSDPEWFYVMARLGRDVKESVLKGTQRNESSRPSQIYTKAMNLMFIYYRHCGYSALQIF